MAKLNYETRLKNGFPKYKADHKHFTAYWDAAFHFKFEPQFKNIKITVTPDMTADIEHGQSDVIITTSIRCGCDCDKHGEVARHHSKPTRMIEADDRMLGLSFGYSVDVLANMLKESGCTCLKESDADDVFHFFDSGEYKNTVIFEDMHVGGPITLNNVNPDSLMDIFKTLN